MLDLFLKFYNNPAIRAGLFFCFGLCLGSFLSAFTYRIPRRINWTTKPSTCTNCNHQLGALDLVPALSWIFLRGQCRYCGTKISIRYPLLELGCGIILGLIAYWSAL